MRKLKVKINGKTLTQKQLDTKASILFKEHEKLIRTEGARRKA